MKKIVIIFIIVIVCTIVFVVLRSRGLLGKTGGPVATPTPMPGVYRGVVPGSSTENDVLKSLGDPTRKDNIGQMTALVYPSDVGDQPINVEVGTDNTVTRIVEPISAIVRFADVSKELGAPDMILYGIFEELGFRLYTYLAKGIALLANPDTQEIKERWYFRPTNAATFTTLIAPGLSTVRTPGKQ